MKRFRFPLQSVAVLRAHAELKAKEALAVAVVGLAEAEAAYQQQQARLRDLESSVVAARAGRFHAATAVTAHQSHMLAHADLVEAARRLHGARDAVKQRRRDYLEAHRAVKIMDRLEQHARFSHRAEELRAEQAENGELAARNPLATFHCS